MDENKEKDLNASADDELKAELEELARTFQQELDKAKAQELDGADEDVHSGELIQDLEDIETVEQPQEDEEIPEEELCGCCGEKRKGTKKNPDSDYCYECEKALRHYPFELLNVIIPVLAILFCFYGCYVFSNHSAVYSASAKAENYIKQNKLYTAFSAYEMAIDKMKSDKMNGEMLYKRYYDCAYESGMFMQVQLDSEVFKSWELKLPHLKSVAKAHREFLEIESTQSAVQEIFYAYDSIDNPKELPYDEIIKKLEALTDQPAKTTPLIDGETEEEIVTTPIYNIKAQKYSRPMILYFEFYVAVICEKDLATQTVFLEKIREEYPEKVWIYGSVLGDLYNKQGKDVKELCNYMKSLNSEDSSADVIEVTSLRIKGDYDAAIELCDKFIDKDDTYASEFLRQKAICCLLKGDSSSAYKFASDAYSNSATPLTADLLMLCSVATSNTEIYDEIAALYKDSEMEIEQEVLDYKNGKITVEQIFTKGDFDIG